MKSPVLALFWAIFSSAQAHQHFRYFDRVRNLEERIIFPQTKWCGDGCVAENYWDLGSLVGSDSCCRSHDLCDDIIPSKRTKHGLTNDGPYTLLNCRCDDEFYGCLKANDKNYVDRTASAVIGYLFFNVVPLPLAEQAKCFKEEHPIIDCKQRNGFWNRCLEYNYDTTKPKVYQWFDRPIY